MIDFHDIRLVHLELTTRCNARCPMCMRNYRGTEWNGGYPDAELTLAQIQSLLPRDFLAQLTELKINGNFGDFSLAKDAREILGYLLETVPVTAETNGSTRSPDWWASLARPDLVIVFGIDGLEDTHHLYRQDTHWKKIIDNAKAYIDAGGRAIWKMIEFDHNRHQIDQCQQLARSLGFAEFYTINQGRDNGPVFDRKGNFSHWLGTPWSNIHPQSGPMIEDHITWFRPGTAIPWIKDESVEINCRHIEQKEIYIAANGEISPCCYLGTFPTMMKHPGNAQVAELVNDNNGLVHGIEHAIKWFNRVEKSWQQPDIKSGRLYTCIATCGITQ